MNRLPKEIYEQLEVKERQPLTKILKPISDKGQIVIRLPTSFNPELNITKEERFEATLLIDKGVREIHLRVVKGE